MTTEKKLNLYNIIALICSIWFLLFGWAWIYWLNVIFVFPFAILGFFLWRKGRDAEKKTFNKVVGWILWAGLVSSLGCFIALQLRN